MINSLQQNRREHPIAHREGSAEQAVSLVKEGCRYVVTRCLGKTLSVTGYEDALQRQENLIGGTTEYFRPDALPSDLHIEPGDTIEVLEVDHVHGFVHAYITLIRGQRYELNRVIPLQGRSANPESVIVTPMLEGDGVIATIGDPYVPSEPAEQAFDKVPHGAHALIV